MKRRGISPVVATILLIAIAVAAVAITYVWYMSFQSRMQEETEKRAAEEAVRQKGAIKIEKLSTDPEGSLFIAIRNVGTVKLTDITVYADLKGTIATKTVNGLDPGKGTTISWPSAFTAVNAGDVITVKVVSAEGASAEAAVTVPPSG